MELNAENIKNEIQSLIKALKDCGGWVKRGNGEGWFNHEILADALALITSQGQRIKELTEENEKLHASCTELARKCESLIKENEAWQKELVRREEIADKHYYDLACEVEDLRAENDRMESVNERWRMDYESLEADNESLSKDVADLQDELKCVKETNAHLCSQYMSENHLRHQVEEMLANGMDAAKADTVRKMQDKVRRKIKKTDWLNGRAVYLEIDKIAKEMLEDKNVTKNN